MTPIQVSDLTDGRRFSNPLVIDKQFVLLDSAVPFSKNLKKALDEWEFTTVYEDTEAIAVPSAIKSAPAAPVKTPSKETVSAISQSFEQVDFDIDLDGLVSKEEFSLNSEVLKVVEKATKDITFGKESDHMDIVQTVYDEYIKYTTKVFTRYVTHKELSIKQLTEAMRALVNFTKANKKYLLRISPKPEQKSDKNYLINHCVRSTIIAIAIAINLNFEEQKITDIAVSSIIHEIGQIRLPPQLYITDKPLSVQARALLSTHTILGFNILKENNFPAPLQLAVLEHHERENGKGYPRKKTGAEISTYGKILAVACVYEAISSPRQYKEAKSTHEAMIEMLRNADKAYDENIIKALVRAVSLFPIGAYVYLSNGKIAQVADSNPNDPRTPLVQLIGEKNELGNPKTIMTDNDTMKIARVLNRDELKDIIKFMS